MYEIITEEKNINQLSKFNPMPDILAISHNNVDDKILKFSFDNPKTAIYMYDTDRVYLSEIFKGEISK